jgi:hypothetical protein
MGDNVWEWTFTIFGFFMQHHSCGDFSCQQNNEETITNLRISSLHGFQNGPGKTLRTGRDSEITL